MILKMKTKKNLKKLMSQMKMTYLKMKKKKKFTKKKNMLKMRFLNKMKKTLSQRMNMMPMTKKKFPKQMIMSMILLVWIVPLLIMRENAMKTVRYLSIKMTKMMKKKK